MKEARAERLPPAGPSAIDFRRLAESSPTPFAVHDARGVFVWANAAAAALVGAPSAEALAGRNMLDFVVPELRETVLARAAALPVAGPSAVFEDTFVRLDGTHVEVETSGTPLGDGLTLVAVRDVSRRVRSERETRTAVSRLRELFELSTEAIGLARDGVHVMVTPAHARLFGYDRPEQLIGVPVLDLIAPEDRPWFLERRARAGDPSASETILTRGLRRDGATFDLEVRPSTFREAGGEVAMALLRNVTEERRSERKLRESERRFRELFDLVPVSLWEADNSGVRAVVERLRAEGVTDLRAHLAAHPEVAAEMLSRARVIDVNATGCAMVGASSREELLGRLDEVFVPESRRAYMELALQLAEGKRTVRFEAWSGTLGGERRWIETTASVVPGCEETWARVLFANADATERLRSQGRLAAIFDGAAEPMAFTVEGRFERVNAAFARQFGFDRPEEAIGHSVGELVVPGELEKLRARHRQRLGGEPPPDRYTTRGRRRDGSEFDVEVKTAGLREGDRVATISIMRDVTEQLAYERRLAESERRFRDLFEFVPVSLFEIDASGIRAALDGLRAQGFTDLRAATAARPDLTAALMKVFKVVAVNAAGRALVGADSLETLEGGRERIYPPESHERYREVILQLAEGRAGVRAEGWSGTVSGERRWIETRAGVIPGHEADWRRLLFASADMTERRRAEEERAAMQERLRLSEKLEAVGRLAGGIAHDFNNILSGILGYTELSLLSLERGSDLHDHQQRIREATLRARDLVRQILAFSRRDSANRRVVDVPTVVAEALTLMRTGVPSTVTLETRIDPAAGTTLADPTQLHQIVLNLASNARDAVSAYGHIEVAVEPVELHGEIPGLPSGHYVRLRVRDDGAGMDAPTRARLFEPYMTTKAHAGGHGLGLAVVHGIVAASGGAIQVESAPGEGSTFDVYLPRSQLPAAASSTQARQEPARGERILVVDDEPLVRNAHRRLLESLGYRVDVASDGVQALELVSRSPGAFDLVLTDQTMPRLSGADLARELLRRRPGARVILCTGYSDRVDEERARAIGLRALLAKPIDRETLAAAVRRALEG
ncbi:MAG TPA: PAS domain S-box protein [Anaeromyxobacteraceae bacterium]|nr:PAS domain S-box protein [Anaeromyxobacteraceae bacterium]